MTSTAGVSALGGATDEGIEFFEARIRPLLVKNCYECHSGRAKELQGKLRLDSREALRRGGESGPAI
ncbi:MAG TPA: c-type cytochrome domain-containing protein, partial [Planctomycetaceae bacterium]|nr:c-type cytochrome domain-containing protein [Planctomycetaceae bacterium]